MADSPAPTHRPADDAKVEPRGYVLRLQFHPPLKLDRKRGFQFAAGLTDIIDPENAQLQPNEWVFSQPLGTTAAGSLSMTITQTSLEFDIAFPSHQIQWFEDRYQLVLQAFEKEFKPKVLLGSSACYRGIMAVDGDARTFLAQKLMGFDPTKIGQLKRPVHLFGIRFFLPPFEAAPEKGKRGKSQKTDWHVDVKAESLMEDPTKLYLEADAHWPTPEQWKGDIIEKIVGHLATVADYVRNDVVTFLKSSSEGEGE